MQFTHSPEADINFTSRHAEVWIAPEQLVRMFGQPGEADGYKISGRYVFEADDGSVVTLYDWKCTSLYQGRLSPEAFWASTRRANFNIGAHDPGAARRFVRWLCARGARENAWG